jgi:hypothetical protein
MEIVVRKWEHTSQKKRTSLSCVRFQSKIVRDLRTNTGQSFGSLALDVCGFIAVNQIGFGRFVDSRRESAESCGSSRFVTTGNGICHFFAKSADTALGSAIALGANFGLTNALLGRFGVGHDESGTVVK